MRSRKRFLFILSAAVVAAVLALLFSSVLISAWVRSWVWWKTRGTNVTVTFEAIETPFLHPIVLRGVRLRTDPKAKARIDATASRVIVGLNLKGILLRTRDRTLRDLQMQGVRVEIHRNKTGTPLSEGAWNTLHRLLPESFSIQSLDLRLEDGTSLVLLRGVSMNGTPIEAGRFEAGEIVISSPKFRQTFTGLRGAADWQGERLSIAGLTLTRGVDVQSIVTDFSHIGKRRLAVEFDIDAFGGKLRGSIADEWRSRRSNWNMAGSANDISASQTAEAFGFTDRVGGLIHAGKFTFRGDLADALSGTASLWVELTAPAWRDREADVIMAGLSLYGRQIELQQLYIKQKKNELTLNGQSSFPTSAAGWLHPDFRGNVSASIEDLGEFASLFGGDRNDFAGRIEVEGTLNARERNVGGNLVANGFGLTMFKSSIDEFHAELKLKRDETEIAQLELKRGSDQLSAQGKIDNSAEHNYSGAIDATVGNINDYLSIFVGRFEGPPISAIVHSDITSSIWEAWAVLDPPHSKPVNLSGTFPLRIGQSLDQMWNSPLTLTVNIPELYLTELPRRKTHFENGSLRAQFSIADTLRHPRITGYAQLMTGRINSVSIDSRLRLDGNYGAIESLTLGTQQNNASFFGDVNFADMWNLTARLHPNQPLYDLGASLLSCVSRIEIVPVPTVDPTTTQVGEIDFGGGVAQAEWSVTLKEKAPDNIRLSPLAAFTAKTFRFCPAELARTNPLQIGVTTPQAPSPTPKPARLKKRKR